MEACKGSTRHSVEREFFEGTCCVATRETRHFGQFVYHEPPQNHEKTKVLGHLKTRLFTINLSVFGGAMVASHTWWNSNICDGISGSFFRYLSHPKGLKTASLLLEKWLPTPTVERKSMKSQ